MDIAITKRLHISGLSASISPEDLLNRLSTFGIVTSVHGFHLKDGIEQPRKFGYVTIETTPNKFARCLNSLNGSTWKGAKLRIGEAKPDFAERLALERQGPSEEPSKKKQKILGSREAEDMSLVTPENVVGRAGWKVTPLGRIMRPIKMRPEHPLPFIRDEKSMDKVAAKKWGTSGKQGGKRMKVKTPNIRAKRQVIDMAQWGSIYLKGSFLDFEMPGMTRAGTDGQETLSRSDPQNEGSASESNDEVERMYTSPSVPSPLPALKPSKPAHLASLFGGRDGIEWVSRESVGSDVDEEGLTKMYISVEEPDGDFDIIPMEDDSTKLPTGKAHQERTQKPQQATKLKDLFISREEAGFSLLGHLELDLELDDEVPFATFTTPLPTEGQYPPLYTVPAASQSHNHHPAVQLNSKQALFFPHPSTALNSTKARQKDLFDVAKDNQWNWRDPRVGFHRTGTEEEIKQRWEGEKVELTRDWKRRWREAGKISRRGGAAGDGEVA